MSEFRGETQRENNLRLNFKHGLDSKYNGEGGNVVLERTKVSLKPESFILKDGVLEIDASAVAKNEIRLKEDLIKDELKGVHNLSISRIFYK